MKYKMKPLQKYAIPSDTYVEAFIRLSSIKWTKTEFMPSLMVYGNKKFNWDSLSNRVVSITKKEQ
jgi:hypothetical protein